MGSIMIKPLSHYRQKLRDRGLVEIIVGRWRWYKQSFQMDNWFVGRLVELAGNRISIDGVILAVDNPLVTTRHKGNIYFGIYETEERRLTRRLIDRSLPTVEIGASIGGLSCITNKLLSNPRAHVVVECNPALLQTLIKNREINRCEFSVETAALAYGCETITFFCDPTHFMLGMLHGGGGSQIIVNTITLKSIIEKSGFEVVNLISDCEGTEVEMIENEIGLLQRCVKCFVMEKHPNLRGQEAIAATILALERAGFSTVAEEGNTIGMINKNLS